MIVLLNIYNYNYIKQYYKDVLKCKSFILLLWTISFTQVKYNHFE